jgi:DNA-binding XRE family transcriptional regulator
MLSEESRVREARLAAGVSQATLATNAGISRQAVGAIEAGRHRPSVDAALAMARALGRSVEELFSESPSDAEPVLGRPLPDGTGVLTARVGDRVVYSAASDSLAFEGWPEANAILDDGRPRLLPGCDLDGLIVVGCDPALGSVASLLPSGGPQRLIALSGSTGTALASMRQGRAHAALVHDRASRMPSPPPGALRLHVARWRVGLASRGRRARSVAEVCGRKSRVVQLEPGASSQKAFMSAVAAEGGQVVDGVVASGHLEVARQVANGAMAGVTMEPAAIQFGLAFSELEEHVAEIWIDARWRAHPAVAALGAVLRSAAFITRLSLVGGYELAQCGNEKGQPK